MKFHIIALVFLINFPLLAQQVEWASEVIEYSSERSPLEYAAVQVLGKPNVMPQGGDNPAAWCPAKPNNSEYISVGFEKSLFIKQVAIAESLRPGALSAVYLIAEDGSEHLLFELSKEPGGVGGSMFNFFMPLTEYKVKGVKIFLEGSRVDGYFNIDAIGVSNSEVPIGAEVVINKNLRAGLDPKPLGEEVNSLKNELRPILSPDGKQLFFTRQFFDGNNGGSRDPGDIWVSNFDVESQTWMEANDAGPVLNTDQEDYMSGMSPQGNGMLALVGKRQTNGRQKRNKMLLTDNLTGEWREPVPLDFVMDPEFSGNVDFTLSKNRKFMILTAQMDDSYGDQDLYMSFMQKNGKWSDPRSLGSVLNTVSKESSPFLDKDGQTLFFASNGFSGMGGSDIYKTTRLDNTWQNWSEPENLGPRINSEKDEAYFIIPESGGYAYFSRFIQENNADLFKVELPLYEGTETLITLNLQLFDKSSKRPIESAMSIFHNDDKYTEKPFQLALEKDKQTLTLNSEGYYPIVEVLDLTYYEFDTLTKQLYLEPIDAVLSFNEIQFESNDDSLLKDSFRDLDAVVNILISHPKINLTIESHTDGIGTEEANLLLSEKRGKTVLDYLINKGIDAKRMTVRWYGESRPMATNTTSVGRRKNRRVEFKIQVD